MPDYRYFTVDRTDRGAWVFRDPVGDPFVSLAVNHADDSDLRYPHNVEIFDRRYGSRRAWTQGVVRDLAHLNFNTIGWTVQYVSGSWGEGDVDWFGAPFDLGNSTPWPDELLASAGMPYVVQIRAQEIEDWNGHPAYRDVFSPEFEKYADWIARRMASDHVESRNLIGYFLADIPSWIPHASGRFWPGFENLNAQRYDAKLFEVATRYYEVITRAVRRYDPNHLILGDRYNGNKGVPGPVLRAMVPFVDVLSVQYFTGKTDAEHDEMIRVLRALHDATGKPVLIADIGNWMPTVLNPHRTSDMRTQSERGDDYAKGLARALAEPWIIGWHWCGFLENLGRGFGIKSPQDEFYTDMTDRVAEANARARRVARER
ncbi:hypothetical protein J2Y46_001007 [Microbacterium sp. BE35]|uniref:agarase n=1 Tax=Microbacterium sp. BE35 TaxID=2817773 RepID=UPI00285DE21F|nr:agarase [Microbacterium sp. BE35]MDR7188191.1 hypothetical protein [Microbacterium sp. BE35]